MSYGEIKNMPIGAFNKFIGYIPQLRAEELKDGIMISSYPHMKKTDQRKISRNLDKYTNPPQEAGSLKEFKRMIRINKGR